MTERIQKSIEEIRIKSKALFFQLTEEREMNKSLLAELRTLKEIESNLIEKEAACLREISDLKMALEEAKSQVVEVSIPSFGKKEDEIDELVKEIEYCIGQLKK
jgi:chromosome segregation ATPase